MLSILIICTKISSTQHTTKIVINETCRLITLDLKYFYVNTLIFVMLNTAEQLLTVSSTKASLQQITLLLHVVQKKYYF